MFGASIYMCVNLHVVLPCICDFDSSFFFLCRESFPRLKKPYHTHLERVREYLETVKDFDQFISPQSLFLHFLGPKPFNQVRKNVETVKKIKYASSPFYK